MNITYKNNRFGILLAVFLAFLTTVANSQGTDSRMSSGIKDKLFIGLELNPLITNISNEKYVSSIPLSYKKGNSLNFAIEFGYFISKTVGISSGIGYSSFSTELSIDSCSLKYQTTDNEEEDFEMRINGKSIVENQKISFLSIPLCINLRFQAGEKIGFYIKGGVSFDIPVTKTFNGDGIFTYKGYYPAYPVLLENYSPYFPTNVSTSSTGSLLIKSLNTAILASGSAFYNLNSNLQLLIGIHFNKSLTNISAYTPDPDFRISSTPNELNSFMAGSTSAGFQAVGLSVGLKYFIK